MFTLKFRWADIGFIAYHVDIDTLYLIINRIEVACGRLASLLLFRSNQKSKMVKERDQEFLEIVVTSLVDNPESVHIERNVDEMGVLLTLDVHPDDMGKIIGRSGNTAKAIRTLLRVVGLRNNARINLKINEPEGGKRSMEAKEQEAAAVAEAPVAEAPAEEVSVEEALADDDGVQASVDAAMEDLKI